MRLASSTKNLKIFTKKKELLHWLGSPENKQKTVGLVPTMGALHEGHLSLIHTAQKQSDIVVCSIFVNPKQFNDPADLERYPRPVEQDIEKLQAAECDVLFMPGIDEMYAENEEWQMDLGSLENVLEGRSRPGHFQGVVHVVKKLFDLVGPQLAFFGQKDYQQVMVIKKLVKQFKMPVKLVIVPVLREPDGLAMSSRNVHLSTEERRQALALSKALQLTKKHFNERTIPRLKAEAHGFLNRSEGIKLDYFEICDAETLKPAVSKKNAGLVALTAAYVGRTRLIDNIILR